MKSFAIFVAFTVMLCLALSAAAQTVTTATGVPPFSSVAGGPDQINVGNLNIHFAAPVFSKPGRGIPFDYILSYDSSIWQNTGTNWQPVLNWGWRGQSEALNKVGYVSFNSGPIKCFPPGEPWYWGVKYTNYHYHDSFGVTHFFNIPPITSCDYDPGQQTGMASDGSGLTINAFVAGATLTTRAGEVLSPPNGAPTGNGQAQDSNGNYVNVSGSNFIDTLQATALSITGGAPNPLVFTYTDSSGTNRTVTVNYSTQTVQTNFGCGIAEYGPATASLVSSISLPDGSSYNFTYEATPLVPGNVTGRVASIQLPTGATITYTYTGANNGIVCSDGSTLGLNRATADGTIQYVRSGSGSTWTTTATDATPQQNQTVINFQTAGTLPVNFYETKRTAYSGAVGGTVLETVNTCYNGATPDCSAITITPPISRLTVTTQLDSGGQAKVDTLYNTYTLPTEVDEYDWGAGSPSRKTLTSYAVLGNGIVDRPGSVTVQDGGGTQIAQTTYGYDEGVPTATSGVPQHVAVTGFRGNLTSIHHWLNTSGGTVDTTLTYNDTGDVLSIKDGRNNTTNFDYTDSWSGSGCVAANTLAYVTTITDALTHQAKNTYYPCSGLLQAVRDQNDINAGRTGTTYNYDSMLRLTQTVFADGGETDLFYPNANAIETKQKQTASTWIDQFSYLDGYGRVRKTKLNSDPEGADYTRTDYDSMGRVAKTWNPTRCDPDTNPTSCTYQGNPESTWGTSQYAYDPLGRITTITEPDNNQLTTSYSANCLTATDETGRSRKSCTDGLGRLTSVTEPNPSSGSLTTGSYPTSYTYDVLNNLTNVHQVGDGTQSARDRTLTYDSLSRLITAANPESGTTCYGIWNASSQCVNGYDGNGNLLKKTDARNITITYAYDTVNRLTSTTYSDNTPAVSYFYDQTTYNGLTIANGIGPRTGMSDGTGQTAWSYDALGRIATRRQTIGSLAKNTGYSYNLDGSMATITYPSGRTYTYGYSAAGRALSLVDSANSINYVTSATYVPAGGMSGAIYGHVTGWDAITQANSFNNRLQPTAFQATSPVPSTLLDLGFSYSQGAAGVNNGMITQVTNNADNTRSVTYAYDKLNRLTSAATVVTSGSNAWGNSYTYDSWGNLLQKTVTQGTSETLNVTVDANNHINTAGYSYDAAGNLTADGINALVFDAENRANPVTGSSYTYDGDSHRLSKSAGTVYWFDDSFLPLSVGDNTGAIDRDYVFFNGSRIGFYSFSSQSPYYYVSDQLGSGKVMASGDGRVIEWDGDFYPFGGKRVLTDLVSNFFLFTGYELDSETGYHYANFRYESSGLGRFMSPDPMGGDPADPQSWNRYSYVGNDPVNGTDPLGLLESEVCPVWLPYCEGPGANVYPNPDFWGDSPGIRTCSGWSGGSVGEGGHFTGCETVLPFRPGFRPASPGYPPGVNAPASNSVLTPTITPSSCQQMANAAIDSHFDDWNSYSRRMRRWRNGTLRGAAINGVSGGVRGSAFGPEGVAFGAVAGAIFGAMKGSIAATFTEPVKGYAYLGYLHLMEKGSCALKGVPADFFSVP